ncbi:MAG: hypothetical protein D6798_06360 [Deltaproteobacteria bacterium]|nr:MAG: hypothetical protein D6798_06360 [Deltaproteobacteria bacterium]
MSRAEWGSWAVVVLLAVSLGIRLLPPSGTDFETMPILVPTSLTYEARLREARNQPPGRGGAEAVELAEDLLGEDLLAEGGGGDPRLVAEIEALAEERARLLALRDRRHQLNVALMDVGVEVARRLRPDQWHEVVMHRDARRATAEAATFDRLLARLRGAD